MRIAIVGCSHGALDQIYAKIKENEENTKETIDLVLMCGDFQAIRNDIDLQCMAVPQRYRQLGNFYKYYNGEVKAPYLTVVIGGNHEASNHMDELSHGGWLAPNIYYLGRAGVVKYNGVRIGGLSGIYKEGHYFNGHFETTPYNSDTLRSIYHVRDFDVRKLMLIQEPMDIFLSHDWPNGIEHCGDLRHLLRIKPYFRGDIDARRLGNPASSRILHKLQPKWWFSAHLHVHYKAIVDHNAKLLPGQVLSSGGKNIDEPAGRGVTKFMALDKPLDKPVPGRTFVDYIDIESPEGKEKDGLTYDLEWLAITRAMQPNLNVGKRPTRLPNNSDLRNSVEQELMYLSMEMDMDQLDLRIPSNFEANVPAGIVRDTLTDEQARKLELGVDNPQTIKFCKLIGIEYVRAQRPAVQVSVKEKSPEREENGVVNVNNEEEANKKRKLESSN